jgi:hypothetical protein
VADVSVENTKVQAEAGVDAGAWIERVRKHFFSEEKKQKTFMS